MIQPVGLSQAEIWKALKFVVLKFIIKFAAIQLTVLWVGIILKRYTIGCLRLKQQTNV
jgi:hypothetical protein